jgi:hypothetical protein
MQRVARVLQHAEDIGGSFVCVRDERRLPRHTRTRGDTCQELVLDQRRLARHGRRVLATHGFSFETLFESCATLSLIIHDATPPA